MCWVCFELIVGGMVVHCNDAFFCCLLFLFEWWADETDLRLVSMVLVMRRSTFHFCGAALLVDRPVLLNLFHNMRGSDVRDGPHVCASSLHGFFWSLIVFQWGGPVEWHQMIGWFFSYVSGSFHVWLRSCNSVVISILILGGECYGLVLILYQYLLAIALLDLARYW